MRSCLLEADGRDVFHVVLRTLREAVGEKEWHDTTAQLPGEYRVLWRRG